MIFHCEQRAINVVRKAARAGTVKIVTQASLYWANNSCSTLMPALFQLFHHLDIEVISSLEYGNALGILDWTRHKTATFQKIVEDMTPPCDHLISIGDGPCERTATQILSQRIPHTAMIQLSELPKGELLVQQLEYLDRNFIEMFSSSLQNRFLCIKMDQLLERPNPASDTICARVRDFFNKIMWLRHLLIFFRRRYLTTPKKDYCIELFRTL